MRGEANMPHLTFLLGRKKSFRCPGWRQNLVNVFHRTDRVKLVKIHMIGMEALQAALQLLQGSLRVTVHRLFREENLVAIGRNASPSLVSASPLKYDGAQSK